MLEQHVKSPQGASLLSDLDKHGDCSSDVTAGTSSTKENLMSSDHKLPNVQLDDETEDDDEHSDDGIDTSKRRSVLEMASAIEGNMTISANEALKKPFGALDDGNNVSTPTNTGRRESQFWSLQAGVTGRSSMASTLSKIKKPQPTACFVRRDIIVSTNTLAINQPQLAAALPMQAP